MRLVMISLAALTASTACVAVLFLYALVAPTLPAPSMAIAATTPDPNWRGGPIEDWAGAPAPKGFVTLASDGF